MRLLSTLASLFLLSFSVAAHADTIPTFSFSGSAVTFGLAGDTNTTTGTIVIDTTTGVVQSVSFTAAGVTQSGAFTQAGPNVTIGTSLLSFSAASLINFTGGNFNLRTSNDDYVGATNITSTMVTPAPTPTAVTPEPSTWLLLGTGMVGVFTLARRRRNAQPAPYSIAA